MTAEATNLHVLMPSNFRQVVPTLRKIADLIEAGDFGEVSSIGIVLLGDTCEVFGAGPDSDACTSACLRQAGAQRMISPIADHGRE